MHVYCTDGTVFTCRRYDVNGYGLVLYGQEATEERDRYDDDEPEQIGFVPHDKLWYVLPTGVTPQAGLPPQRQSGARPSAGRPTAPE